ncbi:MULTISPECIES: amidase [unclassified Xanthobacter]|uniref:amidase n=1 Tax=unclassified Xanthobacter TaxID=2623496 RepID=UPI001EDF0AA2|nr:MULTISPECIES: amidase [unclassified Xanthobacter]
MRISVSTPPISLADAVADHILVMPLDLGGDGLRVAVKDTIDIAGWPTRAGSPVFADAPAAAVNAAVVERVLAAGCHIIGKANLHELAFGVTGVNPHTGTALNPLFPDRVPGGSSSGSAASVAAGLADFALGTDTGGSVRIPACCCGVFGLKPTFGRVSRAGVAPERSSLDCVGPFAADAPTLTRAMAFIDPTFTPLTLDHAPRFGVLEVEASPSVARAVEAALADAGVEQVSAAVVGLDAAYDAGLTIINAENWAAFGPLTQSEAMGPDVRQRIIAAGETTAEMVAAANVVRAQVSDAVDAALAGVDALVLPTMPDVPPRLVDAGDARGAIAITRFVRAFNLTGHPALTVPVLTAEGLPAGIQLVGRKGDDARLCAIAEWLAAHLPSDRIPGPGLRTQTYLKED